MYDVGFVLIIGVVLLIGGIAALFKIGLWVWIASHASRQYAASHPPAPQQGGGIKKTLAVVSTVLGIVATTVGILKDCGDLANGGGQQPVMQQPVIQPAAVPIQQPVVQPVYVTSTCCTVIGSCLLMDGAVTVGDPCVCFGPAGMIQGQGC